jgi:DNA invertase Pin-like site-specific DNA recombinase
MKLVAYYRVSTKRQGDSGYGLDAQRASVARFVASNGAIVVAEFTEVESGTKDDRKRPQLGAAIERCRLTGASLVVAKLDRLARNAGFVHRLRDSGVDFVCCDMPSANKLTIGILAEVAEAEGETIRRRTKEGIAQARAKGVRWGTGGKNTTPEHLASRAGRDARCAASRAAAAGPLDPCQQGRIESFARGNRRAPQRDARPATQRQGGMEPAEGSARAEATIA